MKRRNVLELVGEGGSIVYEELILEGKTFYTQKISETHFADNEEHTESLSPLYHSFKEAMEHSKIDTFMLSPSYVDPEIWNELSDMFTDYCETQKMDLFTKEEWTKALGIHDLTAVYDDIESLGLSKDDTFKLCEIMCKVQMHEKREEELESVLKDPFLYEGGGPGTRELLLMLAKQVQG
jgi:hypothetical protein